MGLAEVTHALLQEPKPCVQPSNWHHCCDTNKLTQCLSPCHKTGAEVWVRLQVYEGL